MVEGCDVSDTDHGDSDPGEGVRSVDTDDDLRALERFVLESDDLLTLEEQVGRFNIFDALGIARRELQHSNFLAWLLDPAESHGQGEVFLRAVVMEMLRAAREQGIDPPVSPVVLDGAELGGVEVRREWPARTDLTISIREPALVIAIENKVDSSEHSDQLSRYAMAVRQAFPGVERMLVFLTPEGDEASEDGWISFSYADVHKALLGARRRCGSSLGNDVGVFIDQYLSLIRSQFMSDPTIVELCKRIYKNHRRAIDLIVEHANVGTPAIVEAFCSLVRSGHPELRVLRANETEVLLMPPGWRDAVPPIGAAEAPTDWLAIRLRVRNNACWLGVRTGEVRDIATRNRVIDALIDPAHGLGLRPTFKTWKGQKRVLLWIAKIATWDDEAEVDVAGIAEKAAARLPDLLHRLKRLPEVVRVLTGE